MIRRETWYFDKVGTENTPACQELVGKGGGGRTGAMPWWPPPPG